MQRYKRVWQLERKQSVREEETCITRRKILFLRLGAEGSELGSGSWNATESEFRTNNESMSDLEMKGELHKVST